MRRGPVTGRRGFFLNQLCLQRIENTTCRRYAGPSAAELHEHATQNRFVYEHRWQRGDVVIWYHARILHRAARLEPGMARVLHRTTTAEPDVHSDQQPPPGRTCTQRAGTRMTATALDRMIALQAAAVEEIATRDLSAQAETLAKARWVVLVGAGTAQHAAELGSMLLQNAKIDARWSPATTWTRWNRARPGDALILLSHTAGTAHVRRARQQALHELLPVVSITGKGRGWPEAIEAQTGYPIRSGWRTLGEARPLPLQHSEAGVVGHHPLGHAGGPGGFHEHGHLDRAVFAAASSTPLAPGLWRPPTGGRVVLRLSVRGRRRTPVTDAGCALTSL